ncbi:YcaO-like family protein [Aquimarina sp. ERC-38]|uniref:YcaO-like family protein n=1 Tax=Aquimarina sp. ERC-38 TaxID=2949996 RepID=UPI00224528AB|nr:YcaO-like family protein [Aquimarina sp. ERC-38]UZO79264.1 YcaO-like family protein [Aquimarina sp. ERC-38]
MLEKALQLYKEHLPEGYLENFRIDSIDHLGVPIYDTTLYTDQGKDMFNGVGYGKTPVEAEIGAFGELYEGYYNTKNVKNLSKKEASYREMITEFGEKNIIDPLTLVLSAGSTYSPELPLQWTQIQHWTTKKSVWVPVEFISNRNGDTYYDNQLIRSITNGCGAGDTWERAVLHGVLELLQRDGNADSFRALDKGKVIELDQVDEEVKELLQDLRSKGLEVIPKLARITAGCISVYAVGLDSSQEDFSLSAAACGEAADPSYNVALRKAILECASSHTRKLFAHSPYQRKKQIVPEGYWERNVEAINLDSEENRALKAMTNWISSDKKYIEELLQDTVYSQKETVKASSLPDFKFDNLKDKLEYVISKLKEEDLEVYYLPCTSEDAPIKVAKVVIPGIEMELGSYHRIGYRGIKRLLEENSELISNTPGEGKLQILVSQEQQIALGQPYFLEVNKLDEIIDPLYPLYREPTANAAPLALETNYFDN